MTIWVEPNDDPKKKLKYGWRLVELPGGHWAGIDTGVPNKVVGEALRARRHPELAAYSTSGAEVKYGQNSRIDFLAQAEGLPDAYVEVKNVHLRHRQDLAEFPDSVTKRGAKASGRAQRYGRAWASRGDALSRATDRLRPHMGFAADLDPAYAAAVTAKAHARRGRNAVPRERHCRKRGVVIGAPLPVNAAVRLRYWKFTRSCHKL